MPRTSVMSAKASQFGRTSGCIRWKTTDPLILARLHGAVVRLVQELGLSDFAELADAARITQRARKAFMGDASGAAELALREIIELAAKDGIVFPVSEDVLRYIESFV
jgi:hypothetical protein